MKNSILYLTLLMTFFCSLRAEAMKISHEYRDLISFPYTGETIAVGRLIKVEKKNIFIVEKGWTNVPEKIQIERYINDEDYFTNHDSFNKKIIFSSLGKTNKSGNYQANELFVFISLNSPKTKVIVDKLSTSNLFAGSVNPSWQFCESDKECIQVKNQCGNKIGVNSKYKKHYLDFLKTLKEKADCSKEVKAEQGSKCMEYFCS